MNDLICTSKGFSVLYRRGSSERGSTIPLERPYGWRYGSLTVVETFKRSDVDLIGHCTTFQRKQQEYRSVHVSSAVSCHEGLKEGQEMDSAVTGVAGLDLARALGEVRYVRDTNKATDRAKRKDFIATQ
jgi:hypothetical protein